MPSELKSGLKVASISRFWDPLTRVRLKDDGRRFEGVEDAEQFARTLAAEPKRDAVILEDAAGVFWVHAVDEMTLQGQEVLDLDADIRGELELQAPKNYSIHSFLASYRDRAGAILGVEEVAGPKFRNRKTNRPHTDPLRAFVKRLRRAGIPEHQIRFFRGGASLQAVVDVAFALPEPRTPYGPGIRAHLNKAIKLMSKAGRDRITFRELASLSLQPVLPAVPALGYSAALQRADLLFSAYKENTGLILTAAYGNPRRPFSDSYRELMPEFLGGDENAEWALLNRETFDGHLFPEDVADALFRFNTSLWSVRADIRYLKLSFEDFGEESWDGVDAADIYDLAASRLRSQAYDHDDVVEAMLKDPAWYTKPVVYQDPEEGLVRLQPDTINRVLGRDLVAVASPVFAAKQIEAMPVGQLVRRQSLAVLQEGSELFARENTVLSTAMAIASGDGVPKSPIEALKMVMAVTGVKPSRIEVLKDPVAEDTLEEMLEEGIIRGFVAVESAGLRQYVVDRIKTPEQIAHDIAVRLKGLKLDSRTEKELLHLLGPANAPGQRLRDRIQAEEEFKGWRTFSDDVVEFSVLFVLTWQVGMLAKAASLAMAARPMVAKLIGWGVDWAVFGTVWYAIKGNFAMKTLVEDYGLIASAKTEERFRDIAGDWAAAVHNGEDDPRRETSSAATRGYKILLKASAAHPEWDLDAADLTLVSALGEMDRVQRLAMAAVTHQTKNAESGLHGNDSIGAEIEALNRSLSEDLNTLADIFEHTVLSDDPEDLARSARRAAALLSKARGYSQRIALAEARWVQAITPELNEE